MKAYVGAKKQKDGKYQYGLAIYNSDGTLLQSFMKHEPTSEDKFFNPLDTVKWGIKKIRTLGQQGILDQELQLTLVINSKTIYTWFEKGVAPEPYTILFSEVLLESEFLINPTDLVYNKATNKLVRYVNSVEDGVIPLTALFG